MKHWIIEREARLADEELGRELAATRETTNLVATVDIDGFLLSLNPAGHRMLGLPRGSALTNRRLAEFYDVESHRQFLLQDLPGAIQQQVWQSERSFVKPDGSAVACSQTLVAHRDRNDRIEFFSLIAHDISLIRAAEEERKQLREQLYQARKMETIGKLAGGIAHDFNNFLTVIMGYAELGLLSRDADEGLRGDLRVILDTAKKAARLTTQLLDYSSKKMIEPQLLDLNRVIRDSEELLRSMMGETIRFSFKLDNRLWPIHFDLSQLEQILFNLAVNSRDAMPEGGLLSIETGNLTLGEGESYPRLPVPPGNYVRLRFSDDGHGMSEEIKAQIFEPFFTTKERGKGTGLGLSAVYGAVKQNNAEIRVDSEPRRGTSFELLIPARSDLDLPEPELSDEQQKDAQAGSGKNRVLLVEDNDEVRALVTQMLENLGYQVLTARDGLEGELMFSRHQDELDLLVSDVVMPGKDGVQLAHHCQQQKPELKVLLISGHNEEIVYFHDKRQNNIKMLNKPFTPQKLAHELKALTEPGENSEAGG